MTLKTFHRWNAVFLATFIVLHMINHVAGYWGIDAYNTLQDRLRLIYRNPIVEPVLLGSFVLQLLFGLVLLRRHFRRLMRSKWGQVQAFSGGIFALFLTQHLLALVLARWVEGLDTNFYWPASVMDGPPFTWYFVPYYFLGIAALFTHLGCGVRIALLRAGYARQAIWSAVACILLGVALGGFVVSILLQSYFEVDLPQEWLSYLRGFIPSYGS